MHNTNEYINEEPQSPQKGSLSPHCRTSVPEEVSVKKKVALTHQSVHVTHRRRHCRLLELV